MKYYPILFLLLFGLSCTGPSSSNTMEEQSTFDWQGHRGARGLYPENTVPAFLHALSYPTTTTLEMDVVISKDGRVIVSHDPWMHPGICLTPTRDTLAPDSKLSLLELTAEEIVYYDCGSLPQSRFPEQIKMPTHKPTLAEVFASVKDYCFEQQQALPRFNIELKYLPAWETEGFVPPIDTFIGSVLSDLRDFERYDLICLQCFHPPVLAAIRERAPGITLAYLDEFPEQGSIQEKMDKMGFVPEIYSPYYPKLTAEIVDTAHQMDMRVIPWTVNTVEEMKSMTAIGVDGIITDYPNLAWPVGDDD